MTSKAKTVLILGAGASHGYGFPIGSQLRQQILELRDDGDASNVMMFGPGTIRNFVDAFRDSQTYSIDSFLGRRPEFVEIGKAAIAYILLSCEQEADLTSDENKDHWYQYLVNELAADAWENFDPSWLSIVTFNYDRSLLHYMTSALQHTYNKEKNEVLQRLANIQMVQVYGSLGDPSSGIPFGNLQGEYMDTYVKGAAKGLVIIPEGRDDSPTVLAAQKLIESSDRICFLGFGFDATNIRRLGAPNCFIREIENQYPPRVPKTTVATCLGLTTAECHRAAHRLFREVSPGGHSSIFHEKNCINTLRESLILD